MTIRNNDRPFPSIPKVLLDALNERFPERCPDVLWNDREIWLKCGERRLVRFLNSEFARQNENILNREES